LQANVMPAIVGRVLGDRRGLAAAVCASDWIPSLHDQTSSAGSVADAKLAVAGFLTVLVRRARRHKVLTDHFLEGVYSYTTEHGPPTDDPRDPRRQVPVPSLLAPVMQQRSLQFRPNQVSTEQESLDAAALLCNSVLHLSQIRPHLEVEEVVARVCDTMLRGMLV
jgi:hypothetical protein